ncbi:MAG: hypothetical protein CMJ20_05765 [Phycisphaeraceae bacterium]|nr:hypothetical protein [Phycisphaeraceae bacterium]
MWFRAHAVTSSWCQLDHIENNRQHVGLGSWTDNTIVSCNECAGGWAQKALTTVKPPGTLK